MNDTDFIDLDFIDLQPGTVELGWRFDGELPEEAVESMSEFAFGTDFRTLFFSPRRTVSIARFSIANTAIPWDTLLGDECIDAENLQEACSRFETQLAKFGWRLPTEDEFEYAAGGGLFAWGKEIPDGIPTDKANTFTRHKDKTSHGLILNHDPYNVELVSQAFKMGDGGVSICGGESWPIAWLCLSPSFHTPKEFFELAFGEFLQEALVRQVLL